ncbi:TIGR03668 family PPOX class F420-dependent oxidoreductase [Jiangella gansuensis]|uniref:TIGR03668 family PPOX class F420-dependent oxidoreductase n=1 Tax=Jiangella gansuensis TaxID=281473 RepID=UPI00047EA095|nr:TIGR03668 family PPOX class F420-dependent oxidoreductase [Jiangella gansuensis]
MRLDPERCQERMAAARVAHLATTGRDASPHLVPITFALDSAAGRALLVTAVDRKPKSTFALRRLRNIVENPKVAVLCDLYDEDWTRLWWVRADGRAAVATGGPDRDAALAVLCAKYPQYRSDPPGGPVIMVTVTAWSGWAFTG